MPESGSPSSRTVRRALRTFGRFWWDFLIGDTPELFVATVLILVVIRVVAVTLSSTAAWIALPALVVGALALTVRRGRRNQ